MRVRVLRVGNTAREKYAVPRYSPVDDLVREDGVDALLCQLFGQALELRHVSYRYRLLNM